VHNRTAAFLFINSVNLLDVKAESACAFATCGTAFDDQRGFESLSDACKLPVKWDRICMHYRTNPRLANPGDLAARQDASCLTYPMRFEWFARCGTLPKRPPNLFSSGLFRTRLRFFVGQKVEDRSVLTVTGRRWLGHIRSKPEVNSPLRSCQTHLFRSGPCLNPASEDKLRGDFGDGRIQSPRERAAQQILSSRSPP